jgi:hypothetical protein
MPGVAGEPVVTTLVCFFIFACEAAGALSARYSLRPLVSEGGTYWQNSGDSRRGNAEVYPRHCEEQRDEAIQLASLYRKKAGLLRRKSSSQ